MLHQNPYESDCSSHLQSDVVTELSLIGITKAFALWGGSFTVTITALLLVQCYPKLPDPQPLSFYVVFGAIFIIGSLLSWALGCIADVAGRDRLLLSQLTISMLFIIMAAPGLIVLYHYGLSGNAVRKTLMFLIPTIAYTSNRNRVRRPVVGHPPDTIISTR